MCNGKIKAVTFSYEFDAEDNRAHIEAILQNLSGRDDMFYGTNMEVLF